MLVLGTVIVAGFFTLLGLLLFIDIKLINESLINIAMGGLMSSFGTVVGYFFGSSNGSKVKTELLSRAEPIEQIKNEL